VTNKLTTVSNRNVLTNNHPTSSLLGRGLNNLKNKANVTSSNDLESTYRQARDAYNQITCYDNTGCFHSSNWINITNSEYLPDSYLINKQKLVDISLVLQELANKNFCDAY
jgi:hypothetical protein